MSKKQADGLVPLATKKWGCTCVVIAHGMDSYAVLVKRDELPGHAPADRFVLTNLGQARRYLG